MRTAIRVLGVCVAAFAASVLLLPSAAAAADSLVNITVNIGDVDILEDVLEHVTVLGGK
ncbi:hypothetical protein [Amycolatopsis suaedae]|uniref:hypothetical protein n=1 Tax=Amycolatopsis suaedae TaxID=2510978 RepID=UPI0013EF3421|nr:hypothetical protein [Amycolatopsis suaedae]